MKRIVLIVVLLAGLSIAFLSCRSRMPCPTYTADEPQIEETSDDKADN